MTKLTLSNFDEFFAAMNDGHVPFSWQCELLEYIVRTGRWPDQIAAPTGAGKSSVVDVHIFANALFAAGEAPRVPRRLHTVVNRRGLVDNQYQRALEIQRALTESTTDDGNHPDVVRKVADALRSLVPVGGNTPCIVSVLRGGLSSRSLPVSDLASCAVIASTPDMWGSRALFQGYGSTRYARPRETTLVTSDSVIVLDEAHLNRQLLITARRIREIQLAGADTGLPALQVVETTATPANQSEDLSVIGVDPNTLDASRDAALQRRLHATKQLKHLQTPKWNGRKANRGVVDGALEQIHAWLEEDNRVGPIGCIVNHVDTALKVANALKRKKVRYILLVGRLRPFDLQKLEEDYPGVLTPAGNKQVDVVVATQTLEVGVDVDFQYMVTELAPATAIQQRSGRVNRLGKYDTSELAILEPVAPPAANKEFAPYQGADLHDTFRWLTAFESGADINPALLASNPAPATTPTRLLYQRLEYRDVELLAKSAERRANPIELDFWLRDSLEAEAPTAGVVLRKKLPQTQEATVELLEALPPRAEEVFPGSISTVRDLAVKLQQDSEERHAATLLLVYRAGDIELLDEPNEIKPGDTLIVSDQLPFTTQGVLTIPAEDEQLPDEVPADGVTVYLPDEEDVDLDLFRAASSMTPAEFLELWYDRFPGDAEAGMSIEVSASSIEDPRGDLAAWILRRDSQTLCTDAETVQEWSPRVDKNTPPPSLIQHQTDVAERARIICDSLSVNPALADRVVTASLLHDEGKRDPRFQRMLGNLDLDQPWAKSRTRSRQEIQRAKAGSGLPVGWRHEQLSAAMAEDLRLQGDERVDELVVHIVGASHGRGRDLFPQVGEELLVGSATAQKLFTQGQWESQVRKLTREYGAYTLAACEALERAADAQISGEGR